MRTRTNGRLGSMDTASHANYHELAEAVAASKRYIANPGHWQCCLETRNLFKTWMKAPDRTCSADLLPK